MKTCSLLLLSALSLAWLATACDKRIELTVTDEVINSNYLGNGVEWDPYDEAASWGCPLSESEWDTLYARLDYMQPQYVRCMINSPFTYFTGKGFEDGRNAENLLKLLSYCQSRDVMVVYGEYNPPTWDKKGSQEWVEASVKHLNWLVADRGFDCIKHFVIFNEPDGNWASTNGDFGFWREMVRRFQDEMDKYPVLKEKVDIAGPDAVIDYRNPASPYDAAGWLKATVEDVPEVGLYDMHAYPGQRYVRSGEFEETLKGLKALTDKPIILGEAGFKYFSDPADSALAQEYWRRVDGHPFTKGSDCNMLVYDPFYALDMPLLLMSVMNAGFSGAAAWMLDDAMHSNGDSGKTEDVKLWGMWNILGGKVFGDASQEEVRPWYYTWSLMCRHFPSRSQILRLQGVPEGMAATAARKPDGTYAVALVNLAEQAQKVRLLLPEPCDGYSVQYYTDHLEKQSVPASSQPVLTVPAQAFALFATE